MSSKDVLSILSGAIAIIGYCRLVEAWKAGWLPRRASWFIWILVLGTITVIKLMAGDWQSAILPGSFAVGTTLITILSFIRGEGEWDWVNTLCITLGLAGLALYVVNRDNAFWSQVLNIAADCVAGIPTIVGLCKDPKSEDRIGWSIFSLSAITSWVAVKNPVFAEAGYAIFATLFNLSILSLTYRKISK